MCVQLVKVYQISYGDAIIYYLCTALIGSSLKVIQLLWGFLNQVRTGRRPD